MEKRPPLTEYVMARLISFGVMFFLFFAVILFLLFFFYPLEGIFSVYTFSFFFVLLGFLVFSFVIYRVMNHMQSELIRLNSYIEQIDAVDNIEHKESFITQEFEDLQQNLLYILKKSKKREVIKQRYNAKLKLKNRQRGDMISAIAHEFRNPITSIVGYAQTLEEDRHIPLGLRENFLKKIYTNGQTLEALLSRLILWNTFESKETRLEKTSFDLKYVLNEIKQQLEESYSKREIKIQGLTRTIYADRTLLEVVIKNLIENALKYSDKAVEVTIEASRLCIIDRGIGIKKNEIEKVTKKFYRSQSQTWNNSLGLGLSIVKTILTLHKIKLEIQSIEGEGSIFSFEI